MNKIEILAIVGAIAFALVAGGLWGYGLYLSSLNPTAYIDKIDKNGTVWIKLNNIDVSENTTIYLYYGDTIDSSTLKVCK